MLLSLSGLGHQNFLLFYQNGSFTMAIEFLVIYQNGSFTIWPQNSCYYGHYDCHQEVCETAELTYHVCSERYRGGDTRGAGGALAPPLFEEGGLSPPTFHAALHSSRSDVTQPATPIRNGLNCACVFLLHPSLSPHTYVHVR